MTRQRALGVRNPGNGISLPQGSLVPLCLRALVTDSGQGVHLGRDAEAKACAWDCNQSQPVRPYDNFAYPWIGYPPATMQRPHTQMHAGELEQTDPVSPKTEFLLIGAQKRTAAHSGRYYAAYRQCTCDV